MHLQGGYKTQSVVQIGNVLGAFDRKLISFRALRVYFAALAAAASREAAMRSRGKGRKKPTRIQYNLAELARLCGRPGRSVRRELKSLEAAGLLLFSEAEIVFTEVALPHSLEIIALLAGPRSAFRLVPLPRTALRFIARSSKIATIKTMLAYCVRGLTLERDGTVRGKGTAKASWIASACRLSVRSVRHARAELVAAEFITSDIGSKQWKLNRDGAYFSINMAFAGGVSAPTSDTSAVVEGEDDSQRFARLQPETCTQFSPPYKDPKTPNGSKNQKAHRDEGPGVRGTKEGKQPNLRDIQREDLKRLSGLKALFPQAVRSGWIGASQAEFQNFVAAAVRANRADGDPVRIFVAIVRGKLWHHITLEQEDRARAILSAAGAGRKASLPNQPPRKEQRDPDHDGGLGRALTPLVAAKLISQLTNQPLAALLTPR